MNKTQGQGSRAMLSAAYQDGYKNGRADRLLRLPPSQVALNAVREDYARGYHAGYFSLDVEP